MRRETRDAEPLKSRRMNKGPLGQLCADGRSFVLEGFEWGYVRSEVARNVERFLAKRNKGTFHFL